MPRPKTQATDAAAATPKHNNGQSPTTGDTVAGYFRKVFEENPQWLHSRSNDQMFSRWLLDHPGETEVPERIRQNLSNVKSVLRKKARKKRGRPKKDSQPIAAVASAPIAAPRKAMRGLDSLEEEIDECLTLARSLDREGLADVIGLLRRARNGVVWEMGQ
jgi:hypothetical protein